MLVLDKSGFKKIIVQVSRNDGHSINTAETYIHSQFIVTV